MKPDLRGQTALVTGAGRGIGAAISGMLAESGAAVVLAARSNDELEQVAERIRGAGGTAFARATDISDESEVTSLFRFIAGQSGRLDILVNNAGVGRFGPVREFPVSEFDHVLAVNLRGAFLCCREAMSVMVRRKSGTIINVASVVGFRGYENQAAYTASKHGVMGLTKALAIEAQSHNIRVSAVLPGGVDTALVREARPDLNASALMQPVDIAQAIEYLLSLSERAAVDQIYIRRRMSKPF